MTDNFHFHHNFDKYSTYISHIMKILCVHKSKYVTPKDVEKVMIMSKLECSKFVKHIIILETNHNSCNENTKISSKLKYTHS